MTRKVPARPFDWAELIMLAIFAAMLLLGLAANGLTEILAGLQEGEQVVTVGQLYLRDNDKVTANRFAPWDQK